MKIINALRIVIFVITISISIFIFTFYMAFELDNYTYYTTNTLTKAESDEIKDMAGLSQLSYLIIEGYKMKISFATDYRTGGYVLFHVALPETELANFREYIATYMSQPNSKENPYVNIVEDSLHLKDGIYRMKMEYRLNKGSSLFSHLMQNDRMKVSASARIRVLFQFVLVIFLNCLIILPYKKIQKFLSARRSH